MAYIKIYPVPAAAIIQLGEFRVRNFMIIGTVSAVLNIPVSTPPFSAVEAPDNEYVGKHSDYTGSIGFTVVSPSASTIAKLFVNDVEIERFNVTAAGNYFFASRSFDVLDSIRIDLVVEVLNYSIKYTSNNPAIGLLLRSGINTGSLNKTIYSGSYSSDPITGYSPVLPLANKTVQLSLTGSGFNIASATLNGVNGIINGAAIAVSWNNLTTNTINIVFDTL